MSDRRKANDLIVGTRNKGHSTYCNECSDISLRRTSRVAESRGRPAEANYPVAVCFKVENADLANGSSSYRESHQMMPDKLSFVECTRSGAWLLIITENTLHEYG